MNKKNKINTKSRDFPHPMYSIRVKLSLFFLVPVLFIIILGVTAYFNASKSIVNTFTEANITSFNTTSDYYEVILNTIEDKALQLKNDNVAIRLYSGYYASNPIQESDYYSTVSKDVKNMATADRYIGNIAILMNYGNSITTNKGFDSNISPYDEFDKSEEGSLLSSGNRTSSWSGYHQYLDDTLKIDNSQYAITLTTPFLNSSLKQIGYVMMDVKMDIITEALYSLELPKQSLVAFISPDGREVTPTGMNKNSLFTDKSYYREAVVSESTKGHDYIEYNGDEYLFIFSKVGKTGALLCSMIPSTELTNQADSIKYLTLIIVLIAAIVSTIIGIMVASGISKEIKNIINKLSIASGGDLTVMVHTRRNDEFHVLSNSINHMIMSMRELIMKASGVSDSVIHSTDYVIENSQLLLAASKDISTAIGEIQTGIIQQADDTEQCLKQTNDLTEKINIVHNNSYAIEKIASATKNEVKDGIEKIDELNEATKASIIITNETIQNIEELELQSQSISEIITVMNTITEQTNLLSLNASIEAARAGVYGRGFSVVADEIGMLSNRSVMAASEIEEIVDKIKKKTYKTVETVKQADSISRTTEISLTNVIKLFSTINIHVDDLVQKLDKIMEGLSDIESVKKDTLRAIESISIIAEGTSASSEEVEATTHQQLEAVTKLNEAVKVLQNDAGDLKTSLQLFKIEL